MIDLATFVPTPLELIVALALLIACVTDLRTGHIPNALTFPLWGIGPVWHLVLGLVGAGVWYEGLVGLAVLFPVHFALWAIGLDKGGDAKLMIGVGACLGWWIGIEATVWAVLLMLPVSLVLATVMGKLKSVWQTLLWALRQPIFRAMGVDPGPIPEQTYIPKAPVIALAVLLARLTTWGESVAFGGPP